MDHGYAPYHETAFKAALRLAGAAAQGAASGEGRSFIGGLGTGFGQSMQRADAARIAAEQYALKQEERQRQAEKDTLNQQFIQAEIEKMKKPEKPPKPEKVDPWNLPPDEQKRYYDHLQAVEAAKNRGKPAKEGHQKPAAPKPQHPRAAVMKRVDAINGAEVNDPAQRAVLQRILANPPTPEEGAAAAAKLRVPGTTAYRR